MPESYNTKMPGAGSSDVHQGHPPSLSDIEPHHLGSSLAGHSEIAAVAITNVIRAASNGDLPLFAVTLGLPRWEFVENLNKQSQCLVQFSQYPSEAPNDRLPNLFPPLVELLWDHRSSDDRLNRWLALALAAACFGRQHLWQDLGLRGRDEVSYLVSQWFPKLFELNVQDLKWKRLFFRELGRRFGNPELKSPACDDCDNHRACFRTLQNG